MNNLSEVSIDFIGPEKFVYMKNKMRSVTLLFDKTKRNIVKYCVFSCDWNGAKNSNVTFFLIWKYFY